MNKPSKCATLICCSIAVLKAASVSSWKSDEIDYAVYFEANGGKPNPFGQGFTPKSPPEWDEVEAYPIFTDWGNILDDKKWWSQGNMCEDRSDAEYADKHRQSPVILTAENHCQDNKHIFHAMKGKCDRGEIDFETTPYGLNAYFADCEEVPTIEHSLDDDPWKLIHMVLKVPAEHQVGEHGEVERYDAELQLYYKGYDYYDKGLNGHAENIAATSIFLEARGTYGDDEVEKYIVGWENFQKKQYEECGVKYDEEKCALSGDRNPDQCDKCYEDGCCDHHRKLNIDEQAVDLSLLGENEAEALVREQKIEMERLQSVLDECQEEDSTLNRNLWRERSGTQDCEGSYYCLIDLFKSTGTQYYYNYRGSLTVPPCTENVHWRVMMDPIIVSVEQMDRLEKLTYKHLKYPVCELTTVGKSRVRSRCKVDVNRPIQALSRKHMMQMCDSNYDAYEEDDEEKDEDEDEHW